MLARGLSRNPGYFYKRKTQNAKDKRKDLPDLQQVSRGVDVPEVDAVRNQMRQLIKAIVVSTLKDGLYCRTKREKIMQGISN